MGKSARLDPANSKDREFMMKTKTADGRSLWDQYQDTVKGSMVTQERVMEKPSGVDQGAKKLNMFRNNKPYAFGRRWGSDWELQCYMVLKDMQGRCLITGLEIQVEYSFEVNAVHIAKTVLDFRFRLMDSARTLVVADAKSIETAKMLRWRYQSKLMKACHGIDVAVFYKGSTDVQKSVLQMERARI